MGKRELLLAVAFVIVGFGVYRFTAPPADPNRPGFSFSNMIAEIRREIRGQRASAEGRETTRIPVQPAVREVRITLLAGAVTITGEDRADVEAELHVRSSGVDTEEAERLVKATRLKVDEAGALLILVVDFPREGRQTASLTLKIPSSLGVRMDNKSGTAKISRVASVALGTARGETTITDVPGAVALNQRGSRLTLERIGSLRLQTGGGVEAHLTDVRETNLNLQGGELRAQQLAGGLEVEARNAEVRFEQLDKLRGPVRVNAIAGEIFFTGLRTEARLDGRDTEMRIDLAAPVTLAVYGQADDHIEVTLPAGGSRIDAIAADGTITLDDALQKLGLSVARPEPTSGPAVDGQQESRVTGTVRGGGPIVTVRNARGDIALRSK